MKKFILLASLITSLNVGAAEITISTTNSTTNSKVGEIAWTELATTNVQAAKAFYGKVFGWEFVDKNTNDMSYTFIKKDGKEFAGIWAIPAEQKNQIPPHWLTFVTVEDIEKSLKLITQNGGQIVKPVQTAGDMGLFAVIQDPAGAHIALWQSLEK